MVPGEALLVTLVKMTDGATHPLRDLHPNANHADETKAWSSERVHGSIDTQGAGDHDCATAVQRL